MKKSQSEVIKALKEIEDKVADIHKAVVPQTQTPHNKDIEYDVITRGNFRMIFPRMNAAAAQRELDEAPIADLPKGYKR